MWLDLILQAIVTGILLGGIYSLICVGLTLTYRVMRIINFAHGEFLMIAMYGAYFFSQGFHAESYWSVVLVLVVVGVVIGVVGSFLSVTRFLRKV